MKRDSIEDPRSTEIRFKKVVALKNRSALAGDGHKLARSRLADSRADRKRSRGKMPLPVSSLVKSGLRRGSSVISRPSPLVLFRALHVDRP